jgi:hypothetical protein
VNYGAVRHFIRHVRSAICLRSGKGFESVIRLYGYILRIVGCTRRHLSRRSTLSNSSCDRSEMSLIVIRQIGGLIESVPINSGGRRFAGFVGRKDAEIDEEIFSMKPPSHSLASNSDGQAPVPRRLTVASRSPCAAQRAAPRPAGEATSPSVAVS